MTRYKRTMRARLADFYDELDWWYGRNKQGLAGGFLLGVLVAAIAAELVLGA